MTRWSSPISRADPEPAAEDSKKEARSPVCTGEVGPEAWVPMRPRVPDRALSKRLAAVTSWLVWSRIASRLACVEARSLERDWSLLAVSEKRAAEKTKAQNTKAAANAMPPRAKKLSWTLSIRFSV